MKPIVCSPFQPDCLDGKVALVTGGGSGIGFEVTRQLLLHKCHAAVICGRRASFLQQAQRILQQETGARVEYRVCDVRDPEQCQAAVKFTQQQFGRLDILVNGAAGNFLAAAHQLSPKGFATVMAIDTLGTFNMSRAAFSLLAQSGDAVILNISATLQYGATHWQVHASAAKAAVDSLTRSLALEWGSYQIRVVGIAPGPIADTPGTTKLAPGIGKDNVANMVTEGIPLKRMGEAWEIGHAAVFLCTARYITGDVLVVDGGQWLYKHPMVPQEMVAKLSRTVESKSRNQAPRSKL
ncbi:peroxisomal 2,4-dienoyl-CoA reductase [Fistulifera solaris]|uniref:2,4-dienoyl-CoA reductase [(3E)-enoyl-CoA-producing] n=1 Tax=Fistulifera solaris TaxID=1519565 RepID=A0A1Z5KLY0_FISSO|nr:peroxisomal 2,4-dienoyl-CoA reductase [Fistulifera solaris]|eukprot:GAX26938.1 peroxisomal 2,4-dienoyl-CoA reductase [Fistulifera solaris]